MDSEELERGKLAIEDSGNDVIDTETCLLSSNVREILSWDETRILFGVDEWSNGGKYSPSTYIFSRNFVLSDKPGAPSVAEIRSMALEKIKEELEQK
jgi:hypothetical protein